MSFDIKTIHNGTVGIIDKNDHRALMALFIDRKPWVALSDFSFIESEPIRLNDIYKAKVVNSVSNSVAFVDVGLDNDLFISGNYSQGDYLLVQISSDEHDGKRYKATDKISLSSPTVILMPQDKVEINYSSKLPFNKKKELKDRENEFLDILQSTLGSGRIIIRSFAKKVNLDCIISDLKMLINKWLTIKHCYLSKETVGLIEKGDSMEDVFYKDYLPTVDELYTNDIELAEKADKLGIGNITYLNEELISLDYLISTIKDITDKTIVLNDKSLNVRFDYTEACTLIDVNSGNSAYRHKKDDALLKFNIESAKEIARLISLRNIGGPIIIDFLTMDNAENSNALIKALSDECKKDKNKVKVYGALTRLGMAEMVRERKSRRQDFNWIETVDDGISVISRYSYKFALLSIAQAVNKLTTSPDTTGVIKGLNIRVSNDLYRHITDKYFGFLNEGVHYPICIEPSNDIDPNKYFDYNFVI